MREIPPTAGLPLRWRDFVPGGEPLEQGLARFLNVDAVQIECSGTAALVVALTALKQQSRRNRVVLPAYTCPLVAIAVAHCGLTPILCDLRPGYFEFDPQALDQACNADTLAVIPTHLGGRVADLAPALDIARRTGAYVIEDAAQALGATWNGQSVGLAGDIGFFSLAVGKGLTTFEGGVLIAKEPVMREKLREASARIIPRSLYWETRRLAELTGYAALYNPTGLHYAYGNALRRNIGQGRLVEAVGDDFDFGIPLHRVGRYRRSIGAHALARLPGFLKRLESQAMHRIGELGRPVLQDTQNGRGPWPFLMVMLPSAQARDAALGLLWGAGLGVSRLFIHALPDYGYLRHLFPEAMTPNARDFAGRMLTVSNSLWLSDDQFGNIAETLGKG